RYLTSGLYFYIIVFAFFIIRIPELEAAGPKASSLEQLSIEQLIALGSGCDARHHLDSAWRICRYAYIKSRRNPSTDDFAHAAWQYADINRTLSRRDSVLAILRQSSPFVRNDYWKARFSNAMGAVHFELGRLDSALYYTYLSMRMPVEKPGRLPFFNAWQMGVIYQSRREYVSALSYLREAARLADGDDIINLSSILKMIGQDLIALGQKQAGLDTLALAAVTIQGADASARSSIEQPYYEALIKAGLADKGLAVLRQYLLDHDSAINIQHDSAILLLNVRHELAGQRARLASMAHQAQHDQAERKLLYIGIVAALLLATMFWLFFRITFRQKQRIARQNRILAKHRAMLRKQKEQLERLNLDKDTLLSVVSHDVRGPLKSLQTILELYVQGHISEEEVRFFLQEMLQQAKSASALLDDVLMWAKAHMQGMSATLLPVDLRGVVNVAIDQVLPLSKAVNARIEIEGKDLLVRADEGMLKVAVRNLLANALGHGGTNVQVSILIWEEAASAMISVHDSGPGLPPDVKQILQEDDNLQSKKAALSQGGLGLLLVREFMRAQGGRLTLARPATGTEFILTLPK
ncbi:HAMP domain-containing sensor histidine kinase, partial [Nostoc sp. NIES-2111]